jgi:beta-lactamase regulating signal transducer with metallopeptidase domain
MILYTIKTIICSGLLLLIYSLLLEKEKMHRFNRFFLLSSMILTFIMPLIQTEFSPFKIQVLESIDATNKNIYPIAHGQQHVLETSDNLIPNVLIIIYCLITSVLALRFMRNIHKLFTKVRNTKKISWKGINIILVKESIGMHTFLNNIFVNERDYDNLSLETELFTHELTHAKQKHSLDIIFIEILQIFLWFNPFLILYRKAIKLNHEFLADDFVIQTHKNVKRYQQLLLSIISSNNQVSMSSCFNFLITKKRMLMMTQQRTRKKALLKQLASVPILLFILLLSCKRVDDKNEKSSSINKDLLEFNKTNIQDLINSNRPISEIYDNEINKGKEVKVAEKKTNSLKYPITLSSLKTKMVALQPLKSKLAPLQTLDKFSKLK